MGPLDFSEITKKSNSRLPPPSLPASSPAVQSGATRRRGGPQATSCCSTAPRGTPATLWSHSQPRWTSPPLATLPRRAPRPPPRRRRGELGIEPGFPISRAPQPQEHSRNTFPSHPLQLPTQTPQNTAAVHTHAGELALTVAPPLQTLSTHTDPANSFASLSRSSPTASYRLSTTRAPSPPITTRNVVIYDENFMTF